ncbi:hypothetical protein LCGC14_2465780, partial [marine sediment metagenome]
MIHENKDEFIKALGSASKKKGFLLPLIEKDYYLTLILSRVYELSENLVFKGGTCINKVYYVYYRLSEDLDFSMILPQYEATRGQRRKCIQPVKDKIEKFIEQFGMRLDDAGNPGRNESKQYVYYFVYQSALREVETKIKFEIGLRFNPFDTIKKRPVQHAFLHPFTGDPLFDGGQIKYPSGNRSAQRELYDIILEELDSRVGIDTREARSIIKQSYENLTEEVPEDIGKIIERREEAPTKEPKEKVV